MKKAILTVTLIAGIFALAPSAFSGSNAVTQQASVQNSSAHPAGVTAKTFKSRRVVKAVPRRVRIDEGSFVSACKSRNRNNQIRDIRSETPGFQSGMPVLYKSEAAAKMRYSEIARHCETRRRAAGQ